MSWLQYVRETLFELCLATLFISSAELPEQGNMLHLVYSRPQCIVGTSDELLTIVEAGWDEDYLVQITMKFTAV